MDKEIWKDIEGYEGRYQVSNMGRVRSLMDQHYKGRILVLKQRRDKDGYFQVGLTIKKKIKMCKVHRLVAMCFVDNPEKKPTVNHINGDKTDNRVINLEWATWKEQTQHAYKNNLISVVYGEKTSNAKLTDEDAIRIRELYVPHSREYGTYALAKQFGVKSDAISRVVRKKTFRHI